ncbi:MAG: hypothetical protein H6978_03880 [Gammaproteobacteria bacterium]|nr:hypothetical protein [Gammaproteobacteria bacterium]
MSLRRVLHIFAIASLVIPVIASGSSQVPRNRTITLVYQYGNATVIQYTPSFTNTEGCAGGDVANSYAYLDTSLPTSKYMIAAIYTAYATGKKVGVGLSGCTNNFGGGVPLIYRVELE